MSDFRAALKNGFTVKVKFVKKDGSDRTLIGTTNMTAIPSIDHPRTDRPSPESVQRIYDLEIGEWRSIRLDSIKEWSVTDYDMV